jgi:proteasome accessory factor B
MQRVVERVLNLLAFLLTAQRPVTAEEIRHTVAGYDQEGDEAFRRTFERDKDLLRELGVPLQLRFTDAWEVEKGYVVPPQEYALEDPGLTDAERAALWLATQLVRLGGQSPGRAAVLKLGGAGAGSAGEPLAAELGDTLDDLPLLFEAVVERRYIEFTYRNRRRRLSPLGLAHRRGHWYLAGVPAGESEVRSFRVDRIVDLEMAGAEGSFVAPVGFRVADVLPDAPWEAGEEELTVVVRFDPEVAWWARRQLTSAAEVEDLGDEGLTARFPVANVEAFLGWMIGFEDAAEVLAPRQVRQRLIEHVRAS